MRDMTAWPTIDAYLAWTRETGCSVRIVDKSRYRCAMIANPASGKQVCEIFLEDTDRLMSTSVARLDRRLGLKSHFFI
jgi:hypothetical protein